jgi:hypothetical protein
MIDSESNLHGSFVAINPAICRRYTLFPEQNAPTFVMSTRIMEVYKLEQDMRVFCVRARSFPNDIGKAFEALISLLPTVKDRTFFGVSYETKNHDMVYNAAVLEAFEGEGNYYGCETYTIKKGEYVAELLKGWKKNEGSIGLTFRKMSEVRTDTMFPCVEWYQGEDVLCMVRIDKALTKGKKTKIKT